MVRVPTFDIAAASSGVIMPLRSTHWSHRFCDEINGRLMMITWRC
jgi:hypothetical protein